MTFTRRILRLVVPSVFFAVCSALSSGPAMAVESGQAAPDFTLASTTGGDMSLSDFKGKKWVFLEFYGSDFAPT